MTAPVVLRLAAMERTPINRHPELRRLFGEPVAVKVAVLVNDTETVSRVAREVGARAVLADTYRGNLHELVVAVAPVPVLRPTFERLPGQHVGPPTTRFAGYSQLTADGELVALADGELAT